MKNLMASELSREQKKMMQLIALIEKQEEEQKKKNEKKKQQVQNQSTPHSNVLKKSQSVMNPSTNVNGNNGPLIKLKPKVIITFAPGALEQNARYMFSNHIQQSSNKVSVEKSSINWYKWSGDPDRTVQGKRAQRDFSNHSERENSPFLRGHQEIFTTARFGRNDSDDKDIGNKRVRTSEGKISIAKSYEDALMLRESQSPDKNLRSQATTQDALVSQNGTTSRQHLMQINSTQFKPPTQVIEEESISLEEQKAALKQEEVVTQMDEETLKILEATSRLQNEMKKRNMQIKPLGDQLFNNISEGKSLRAAILLTAKLKSGQAQTVISRSNQ